MELAKPIETEQLPRGDELHSTASSQVKRLVQTVRRRSARLQVASWMSLTLVIIVVSGGAVFFWYAGSIAAADATATAPAEYQVLLRQEKDLKDAVDNYQQQIQSTILRRDGTGAGCGPVCADLMRRSDSLRAELTSTRTRIAEIDRTKSSPSVEPITSSTFINTTLTRILVVALLVFLVQILASQYRYSLRMSHHFDQVADAIEFVWLNAVLSGT